MKTSFPPVLRPAPLGAAVRFLLGCLIALGALGHLRAQDINATVAPNIGNSDNSVDIPNVPGGLWHFFADPSPSVARMARLNGGISVYPWPTVGTFSPDPGNSFNRIFGSEALRVYPKSLPSGSVITIPFRYSPAGAVYNFNVTVVAGAQVTGIAPIDPTVTNAPSVRWRVTFDAPIAGVTAANFGLSNAAIPATLASVTPDAAPPSASWTVTANVPSGTGLLGLNWLGHRTEAPSVPNTFVGDPYTYSALPFFTQEPASVGINRNTTATLTAAAVLRDDPRTLSYQWYLGSRNAANQATAISGATSPSYTPPSFGALGQFSYFCRVFAPSPYVFMDSQDAIVTVVDPPQITAGLNNLTQYPNGTPTLTVSATGTSLVYRWYRGSVGDTSTLLNTTSTGSYVTPPLTGNTRFWVRVSNAGPTVADSGNSISVVSTFAAVGATPKASINSPYAQSALFVVRDSVGNPIPNFAVVYRVQNGPAGASGVFQFNQAAVNAVSDANGTVNVPILTANDRPGTFQLTAESGPLFASFTCTNLPKLNAAAAAGFTVNATSPTLDLVTATAPQPTGGTFAGSGVTGSTFDPAAASLGQNTLTYTVNGASAPFTVTVTEAQRLVVDFAGDTVSNIDGKTSLREALAYAQALGGGTITFAPALAGQAVTIVDAGSSGSDTALVVNEAITFDGGTGAPVILALQSQGVPRRHFSVSNAGFLTLRNLVLTGGSLSGSKDGGVVWSAGRVDLDRVRLTGNQATNGGAVSSVVGTLNVTNCVFDHNTVTQDGGAIQQIGSIVVVTGSLFSDNRARRGGAIRSESSLSVTSSRFTANRADLEGGALSLLGSLAVTGSAFDANMAVTDGGAIRTQAAVTLTNCTLAANTAARGGALYDASGASNLRYVTVAYNTATGSGGGLTTTAANVVARNSLFAANTAPTSPDLEGSLHASSANNVVGLSAAQAKIEPAADNGGGMPTVKLLYGSPAIDAAVAIAGIDFDQRGVARPQGAAHDCGAFERVPEPALAPQFAVPGGLFDGSALVTLSASSPQAVIRYTIDGTTPTETSGALYAGPFELTASATVNAIAFGPGYAASPTASAFFAVRNALETWRSQLGLAADGSQDAANPSGDGVANLLKFAFNLASQPSDLAQANARILAPNGNAGLPLIGRDGQGQLSITFVRRKAASLPGLVYVVETCNDLTAWNSLGLAGATVLSLDATWERVTVVDPSTDARRFGRVRVLAFTPYSNDFNASLGAATLRGSAVWTNGAVQLTDAIQSQRGSVVLEGPVTGPWLSGFTARFTLNIGPANNPAIADGVSFAVGDLGTAAWSETGPGTANNLTVSFDTYNNGGNGNIGIRVVLNGTVLATHPTNPFTNGVTVPVEIRYDAATGLSLVFNGAAIFNNVALPGYVPPTAGKFGFGARTGAATERAIVDDVRIELR